MPNQKIQLRGGWEAEVVDGPDGPDITINKPAEVEGQPVDAFFKVTTVDNKYGAPMIVQEPSFGFPLRDCGVDHDGQLVGAVMVDESGVVKARVSWSNMRLMKCQGFGLTRAGELIIDSEPEEWYLWLVFTPDKNRMEGFVGVFRPTPPTVPVRVCELEDLAREAVLAM